MSKLNCSNCKYYDFNACDGVDWCKLNHEETGICGNCDREFEDLEEATTHYDELVEENNTFLMENSKMAKEIKDLQSQLAEKDKEIASIQVLLSENAIDRKAMQEFKIGEDEYDLTDEDARNSLCWEVEELKQQLAEKDKKNEELKQRLKDTIKIYSDDFVEKDKELKELRFKARNIFPLVENLEDKVNQDKISFAVEQLTEIIDYVKECWSLETIEGKVRLNIAKKIRLKIEELTHQQEDKGE